VLLCLVGPELDVTKARSGLNWRQYVRAIGPGLVIGASDDDPSGIATYSQAGAQFGLSLLWTALLTWAAHGRLRDRQRSQVHRVAHGRNHGRRRRGSFRHRRCQSLIV